MKLCFLGSGASIHTYRWVRFFAEKGHDVHWLSLVPSGFDDMRGIHFQVISRSGTFPLDLLSAIHAARRWIFAHRPDIVHAHYLGAYGLIGALSADRCPFVGTAWGSDVLFAGESWIKRPFLRYVMRKADLLTCDAVHMIDAIARHGIEREKIQLIYFGVDFRRFGLGPPDAALRESLCLGDSPVVISLRSLEPVYDIETLLRAVPAVAAQVPRARFVIAGHGSERARLHELSKVLGIAERVLFIGQVANHDLPSYLRTMDVYVSTALSDGGLSASTAEAMACGLPVVVTDCADNHKWVEHGVTGYLTETRNPGILAEKLVLLLRNPALRASLGKAASELIKRKLDHDVELDKMDRLYRGLIGPGPGDFPTDPPDRPAIFST